MPNLINQLSVKEFHGLIERMGSCIVVGFDKMTVAQASDLRKRMREQDVEIHVVKNRLAARALSEKGFALPRLRGKCGLVFAPEANAIPAARLVREFATQHKELSIEVLAGIIEGEVIAGADAKSIADMADKQTVRSQIATVIAGPARSLAVVLQALGAGLARCLDQHAEGGEAEAPEPAASEAAT